MTPARPAPALPEIPLPAGTRIIADLHLDLASAEGPRAFLRWLAGETRIPALVVLGDLFDVWIGPSQERLPSAPPVLEGLRELSARGTHIVLVHGNRDFLLDRSFEARTGVRVLPDGFVGILPDATRALLIHGDELCTRDRGYQRLKRVVRSAPVRGLARAMPLSVGAWVARRMRRASVKAVAEKRPEEKSLQEQACRDLASEHRAELVVCGHAHEFRDVKLAGGPRWIVLDAFGGARDALEVGTAGDVRVARASTGIG